MKYRKLPVVIEAFKWTGGPDQTEDPEWIIDAIKAGTVRFDADRTADVTLLIDTLEGTHRANQGDYVIQGIKGELYPCKPEIFEATYEAVSESSGNASALPSDEGGLGAASCSLPNNQKPLNE